jgi:hypothetical protein
VNVCVDTLILYTTQSFFSIAGIVSKKDDDDDKDNNNNNKKNLVFQRSTGVDIQVVII